MVQENVAQRDGDLSIIAQMKTAILKDLAEQYQGGQDEFLQESSMVDPQSEPGTI